MWSMGYVANHSLWFRQTSLVQVQVVLTLSLIIVIIIFNIIIIIIIISDLLATIWAKRLFFP